MEFDAYHLPRVASLGISPSDIPGFYGLRIIPDVHGCFEPFLERLEEAEAARLYVIQLGDLIDRGPDSPLCVEAMLDVEQRGLGTMILGNHEWSFLQFLRDGSKPAVTRQATYMLFQQHGTDLLRRFSERVMRGPLWIRTAQHLFVHAAFHPRMISGVVQSAHPEGQRAPREGSPNSLDQEIMMRALLGEREIGPDGKRRYHRWIDLVPRGLTVIVGHEVMDEGCITVREGKAGGKVIFADTGSWRSPGSSLAFIDIAIDDL